MKWRTVTEVTVDLDFENNFRLAPNNGPTDEHLLWEEFEPNFLAEVCFAAKSASSVGDLQGLVFFGYDELWNATATTDDPSFIERPIGQIPYTVTEEAPLFDKATTFLESAD